MNYIIKKRCFRKIDTFYLNVSKKYMHTYSEKLMHKNVDDAVDAMYQIERMLFLLNLLPILVDKRYIITFKKMIWI